MARSGKPDDLTAGGDVANGRSLRRRLPALIMIAVLAGAAGIVWERILRGEEAEAGGATCPRTTTKAELTPVRHGDLRDVDPVPPAQVAVLVRNSTNRHRLATRVAARLELMDFAEAAPPDNDPVYPTGTLRCVGQIRFGAKGRGAARTLSFVAPCAQLVRDGRPDDTVDFALGTEFFELSPNSAAREVLDALREREDDQTGGLQSASVTAAPPPPSALARAYPAGC